MTKKLLVFSKAKVNRDIKELVLYVNPKLNFAPTHQDRFAVELEMENYNKTELFNFVAKGFAVNISDEEERTIENLGQLINLVWKRHIEPVNKLIIKKFGIAVLEHSNGRVEPGEINLQTALVDLNLGNPNGQLNSGMIIRVDVIHDLEDFFEIRITEEEILGFQKVAEVIETVRKKLIKKN